MVTLRFLDINKRVVPLVIMLIFTCVSTLVLSLASVSALLSSASQPLRGDMIRCHNEGESVKVSLLSDDPCITCKCHNQEIVCQREMCPNCVFGGHEYKTGEKWKINNCQKCSCVNGEVRCTPSKCSKELICPAKHKLARINGDCCNSCVEDDAQCRVENLTKYITFDDKEYTFKGKCNYILARDCKSKSFSIHLVNRLHNETLSFYSKNSTYFSGTSIMVKVDDTKVRLGIMGRVRVGRKKVRLPHIILGKLSIIQDGQKIVLRANIGIKVIWDKASNIEIIVPPDYKSKTCGLCGNYNSNPEDDFMTKRGNIITDIEKFSYSWRVGKNPMCTNANDVTKSINEQPKCTFKIWEQRYHAISVCNILKSSLFRQCHASISIAPYFGKCLSDMCSCNRSQTCLCTAVQSYANKCQKLGFYNSHWKKKTLCEAMNCPRGSLFSTCSSPCKRTCKNYRKHRSCAKRTCRPGCECPIGQVWHNDKCIYKQLCPLPTPTTNQPIINSLKEEIIT